MRVAILQPNYIPWKGYFDLIDSVDRFVLLDTVQYTSQDWRNRNRIKTAHGPRWLTIPVDHRTAGLDRRLQEVRVKDPGWAEAHWRRLADAYRQAPAFDECGPVIEELYRTVPGPGLVEITAHFVRHLCAYLGIRTPIVMASEMGEDVPDRNERLLSLCEALGATEYVSGPAAGGYLEEGRFRERGLALSYIDYEGFPAYEQVHPPFSHTVTVLDPIFHAGSGAGKLVLRKGSRDTRP